MTKQYFQIILKRAHILVCSFLVLPTTLWAASDFISDFKMNTCTLDICSQLVIKEKAEKGFLAPLYAFKEATFTSINKKNNSEQIFNAQEGYYDSKNSEIVLRRIKELDFSDAIVDLKTGKIQKYNQ